MLGEYRKHSDMERLSPVVPVLGIVQIHDCRVTSEARSQDVGPDKYGILGSLTQRSLIGEALEPCQVWGSISSISRWVGSRGTISLTPISSVHFLCQVTLGQEDDDNAKLSQVGASDDHQVRAKKCSVISGLRMLDDLKCGCELGPWRRGTSKSVRTPWPRLVQRHHGDASFAKTKHTRESCKAGTKEALGFLVPAMGRWPSKANMATFEGKPKENRKPPLMGRIC